MKTQYTKEKLVEMLGYMRPDGSLTQSKFCLKYLHPVMGKPDSHGNFIHIIGDKPSISFMAHHDTVHSQGGMHKPHINPKGIVSTRADCLGADCTTGIWLILAMIEAGIEGVYVVHAGEEIGCVGSRGIIEDSPEWIHDLKACISFDRRGYDSIVTHQMGLRTCSDSFARSLNDALALHMVPDNTGAFTDSNEYAFSVSECTNISVGYKGQHTGKETQDLGFAETLKDRLLNADWESLVFARDESIAWEDYQSRSSAWKSSAQKPGLWSNYLDDLEDEEVDDMAYLISTNPEAVAELLIAYGVSLMDLREELGISNFDV